MHESQRDPQPGLQFDHLGVVVADIPSGRRFLERAMGVTQWTTVIEDPGLGVSVQFGVAASAPPHNVPPSPSFELIAPLGARSPIANVLHSGKHILNHLAYLTPDIDEAGERLRAEGCYPTGEPQPAVAYGGRRVQFFVTPLRFVIELVESPGHRHIFAEGQG